MDSATIIKDIQPMFRDVLVVVDATDDAREALTQAIDLAQREHSRMTLITVERRLPACAYLGVAAALPLVIPAAEAEARWPLLGVTMIHRFGAIAPGGRIVLVVAASSHRRAAFAAAEFLMDYLKADAPFWKRARRADGSLDDWVEAKASDGAAAARWRSDG